MKDFESRKHLVIVKCKSDEIFNNANNFKEIAESSVERVKDRFRYAYRSFHLIATYKIPYIALLDGLAGASVLSMSAKYRVATEKTVFASPGAQFGFFNDSGSSFYLSRLKDNVGIYVGLTGAKVEGFDVKKVGLATHYVESKNVIDLEQCLTTCNSHEDVENVLDDFSFTPKSVETKLDEHLVEIKKCFSGLTVEQVVDNLKGVGSDWGKHTIESMKKMSPTSLKVCHRHLNLGRYMTLEDCARLEWRLCSHFANESDLHEGCRAVLAGNNATPNWIPEQIEDVTDRHLSRFFGPLPDGDELTFEIKRSTEGRYVE